MPPTFRDQASQVLEVVHGSGGALVLWHGVHYGEAMGTTHKSCAMQGQGGG